MCGQRAGFALVLFLVFRLQLFAENSAEDKPAERAAVEHLPAERHREVAAPGMHPCAKAGLLEQQGSHKAHNWAHDADDHQGDGIGNELRAVRGAYKGERQGGGQLFDHKEFQHKGHGHHNGHFVQSHAKGSVGNAAGVQGNVINDHAIHHDGGHDDGKYDSLRQCFGHRKVLLSEIKTADKKRKTAKLSSRCLSVLRLPFIVAIIARFEILCNREITDSPPCAD